MVDIGSNPTGTLAPAAQYYNSTVEWLTAAAGGIRDFVNGRRLPRPAVHLLSVSWELARCPIGQDRARAIPSDKLSDRRDADSRRLRGGSHDGQNSTGKQPVVQLLSWEEPSVMLGSGGWPLESDKRDSNSNDLSAALAIPRSRSDGGRPRRSSRPYSGPHGIAEDCEDTEDEDADALTNSEDDDDDDIFKMEFEGEGAGSNASSNVFRSKRASSDRRPVELRQRRPGGFDDFDDEEDDVVTPLSASFVPPHQMVERGCFSLGLRDELKRKPGVHR
ncbi:unnamed protein product [Phytophthora fragariaefolia]|uniref:Unnamed protein product n=1 Tax=Phytophthora fragariaefolia TaxID=1490495 RepID=A0A9W6XH17_9STRA|nr:unnamed protein product [Phytophthora fragariaefolia]